MENTTTQSQPAETVPLPTIKKPKQSNFLVVILAILLVISIAIAGFFAYQTQNLNKELTLLKVRPIATASPIVVAISDDEYMGWKTYNNEGFFSFRYPSEYTESGMGIISPLNAVRNQKDSTLQNGELKLEFYVEEFEGETTPESCYIDHSSSGSGITTKGTVNVGGKPYETIIWEGLGTGEFTCIANNGYRILINKYPAVTSRQNEYRDILSTFKFTN